MNGAYTRVLSSGVWTVECDFTDAEARCTVVDKKRVELENDNQSHLFRYSKGNKACPDLPLRSIFLLRDKRGSLRTADVFPVVASLPPKNNVCDLELRYDFHDVSAY